MNIHSSHSRNRDFVRACRRRLSELRNKGCNPAIDELIDGVLSSPAPSYYVDYYHACHLMVKALKGEINLDATYSSAECWADMYRDLQALLKRHPTRPLRRMIWSLCAGEAGSPRFYISHRRAMAIIKPYLSNNYSINLQL